MTPELKARVLAEAMREPAADRSAVRRRVRRAWLFVAVLTLLTFGALGGLRAVERPLPFVLVTAVGWGGVALAATWGSIRRGSMVGRPLPLLLAAILATPPALAAWYLAWLGRLESPVSVAPLGRAFVCMAVCVAFAAAPFVVLASTKRATAPAHPRVAAAALGVVASAWASVLMDLHCEHADVLHVIVGHVAPVLLLGLLGFLLGDRLLDARADHVDARSR
jgi:hypothetical protein